MDDKSNERIQSELNKIARGLPLINSPVIKKSPLLTKDQVAMLMKIKNQ